MAEKLVYSIFFTAKADQVKAAANDVKRDLAAVAGEARGSAEAARHYSQAIESSSAAARAAAVATQTGAGAVKQIGQASALSAGQVANLGYQFNDIGVMLSAGQSPLMLAMQQGTQVAQILGPMGAAGAVRALGAAFVQVLSPVNLVTIGTIAAGAALVQWMTGARDEALSLADAVDRLADTTKSWRDAVDQGGLDKLFKQFGDVTPDIIRMNRELQDLRLRQLALDAAEAAKTLSDVFERDGFLKTGARQLQDLFGLSLGQLAQMQALMRRIGEADTIEAQIAAIDRMQAAILGATGGVENMTREQAEFYSETLRAEEALRAAAAATSGAIGQTDAWASAMAGVRSEVDAILASLSSLGGTALSNASKQAELQALQAGKSVREAARAAQEFRREAEFDARAQGANWFERQVIEFERGVARYGDALDRQLDQEREAARERDRPARSGGGGGSSGVDLGLADAQRLYDQTRTAAEQYAAEVKRINDLHRLFPSIVTEDVKGRALDKLKEDYTELGRLGKDAAAAIRQAFDGIFDDPKRAAQDLAAQLAKMALFQQMANWFPSVFGASGAVPLVSRAGGGPISGPGTSTSDSILMWASNGEYMVNAASTARYRPLLEAINSDRTGQMLHALPRRAAGGIVGGGAAWAAPVAALRTAAGQTAADSGQRGTVVQVNNYGTDPATTERRTGPNGEELIEVVVGRQWARGRYDKAARSRHGVAPEPVRR
ncbi:phage tail length tape measure family protein [Rhodovulum strictum]|uniref:Bacteriophage tail tape measure N-terminal domain-containing protein n=1 Tax=Rhodovulum strictum TaxID=58314 RepID=A0A844BAN4_9RHOB|nr:phage tail length tape measure family protein [Rhodovulum strictum]MRH22650.1 hypothetical protein [Rhodovulum strictum]